MATAESDWRSYPPFSTADQRDLMAALPTMTYPQLRETILKYIRPLAQIRIANTHTVPFEELHFDFDVEKALGGRTLSERIRWCVNQFRVNQRDPRRPPASKYKEPQDIGFQSDYIYRRIVYPVVADIAKAMYERAEALNNPPTMPNRSRAQVVEQARTVQTFYAPVIVFKVRQPVSGMPSVVAFIITPALLTYLRGWKVFETPQDMDAYYRTAFEKEKPFLHGIEGINEPGQLLYAFNFDNVFAAISSDAIVPMTSPFSFGTMLEPIFEFRMMLLQSRNGQPFLISRRGGGAAPFTHDTMLDLSRYQIGKTGEKNNDMDRHNCFIYALKMSGKFSDEELHYMTQRIMQKNITRSSIATLGIDVNARFVLYDPSGPMAPKAHLREPSAKKLPDSTPYQPIILGPRTVTPDTRTVELTLYKQHYFLYELVPYTPAYVHKIKDIERLGLVCENPARVKEVVTKTFTRRTGEVVNPGFIYYDANEDRRYSSRELLIKLDKEGWLIDRPLDDKLAQFTNDTINHIIELDKLHYNENILKSISLSKQKSRRDKHIWFADFETTTDGDFHRPYLLCFHSITDEKLKFWRCDYESDEVMVKTAFETLMFMTGEDASLLVYFHNLNYDGAFVLPFLDIGKQSIVTIGANRIIGFKANVLNPHVTKENKMRSIYFRDSYALITAPLSSFAKMFNLGDIHKELLPYTFYTEEMVTAAFRGFKPPVSDFLQAELPEKREDLMYTINLVHNRCIAEGCESILYDSDLGPASRIDILAYAHYYCARDCEVLCAGLKKFADQIYEVTKIDVFQSYTAPSLSYNYLIKQGCFDGCYNLKLEPMFFIRQCVTGGRCMLRRNEKQHVTGAIMDFDAVSLYPSAMSRLHTLKGKPKVVDPDTHTLAWLLGKDACFLEVDVTSVPKELDFPLINYVTEGKRDYVNEPGRMFVDNITIEDLIRFHKVPIDHIKVIRGYYYDEGKNYRIREVIRELFDKRRELKTQNNPLESIYKLLMNSCYGKSILKPVFKKLCVASGIELGQMIAENSSDVLCWEPLYDGTPLNLVEWNPIDENKKYLVKQNRSLIDSTCFPAFGVQVLSMSKRIMSEVMTLAQDLGMAVYYTDTDSIHIDQMNIEPLSQAFIEKYNRPLIGPDMGQFHSDFPKAPSGEMYVSTTFIGVGKKAYLDILKDPMGLSIDAHVRLKGIPYQAICNEAQQRMPDSFLTDALLGLYEQLFWGEKITFNLLYDGAVSFFRDKHFRYHTRDEFKRGVCFGGTPVTGQDDTSDE